MNTHATDKQWRNADVTQADLRVQMHRSANRWLTGICCVEVNASESYESAAIGDARAKAEAASHVSGHT